MDKRLCGVQNQERPKNNGKEKARKEADKQKVDFDRDIISFSLTELRVPTLRAVLEMTLAEYYIRLDGYKREQAKKLFYWRRTWYNALVGPHYDPAALPKTESAYLPIPEIDGEPKKVTKNARELFEKKMAEYEKNKAKQ